MTFNIRRLANQFFPSSERNGQRKSRSLYRPAFEQLESRIVLAAASLSGTTLSFLAGTGESNDLTLSETGGVLTIRDDGATITPSAGFTVVSPNEVTIPTAAINAVSIQLGDLDDIADASGVAAGINTITWHGNPGSDTIKGSQVHDVFHDGPGSDSIDGQGQPSIDQWVVNRDENMTLTNTTLTIGGDINTYTGIEWLALNDGAGDNTIDASAVTAASGIGSITYGGSAGDDTIIGSEIHDIFNDGPGNDSIDGRGQPSIDQWVVNRDENMTLTNTTLTVGGEVNTYTGIEWLALNDGAGDHTIDASAVTAASGIASILYGASAGDDTIIGSEIHDIFYDGPGNDSIDGRGQPSIDQWIVNRDENMTLTNTTLTVGGEVNTYTGIEWLALNDGAGDHTIDASAVTAASGIGSILYGASAGDDTIIGSEIHDIFYDGPGNDSIDGRGQPSIDQWIVNRDENMTLTNTTLTVGGEVNTYTGIEWLALNDGAGDHVIDTSSVTVSGSGVLSLLISGGDGNDRLKISADVAMSGAINGGAGEDTLDVSGYASDPTVVSGPGTLDGDKGTVNGIRPYDNIDHYELGNAAPELGVVSSSATLANKVLPGDSVTVVAYFTDADTEDSHTATITWGDGTTTQGVVNEADGVIVGEHEYQTGGIFEVVVTVVDTGGASDNGSTNSAVTGGRLTDDGVLQIVGSNRRDWIHVGRRSTLIDIHASLGGHRFHEHFQMGDIHSFQVVTCDGNDFIKFSHRIQQAVSVDSGAGDDFVWTGAGPDIISTGDGHDFVKSNGGNDSINAGSGSNTVWAGDGADLVVTGSGRDWVRGGNGDDIILTGAGHDYVDAGRGNDIVVAGEGNDWIQGGFGSDLLLGGLGKDKMFGGHGDDLMVASAAANQDDVGLLDAALADWLADDLASALFDLGAITDDGDIDRLKGSHGDDHLIGGPNDILNP